MCDHGLYAVMQIGREWFAENSHLSPDFVIVIMTLILLSNDHHSVGLYQITKKKKERE
jgi:hypothetical protein